MKLPLEKDVKTGLQLQAPPLKFTSKLSRLSQKFLTACAGGNIALARACLRSGRVDINYSDGTATPLTAALASNSHVLVQLLMDQPGLDVNTAACNSWTPLHLACLAGDTKAIVRLGEHSRLITVNSEDDEGETPIMLAVWEGHTEVVREMVKIFGVNLNTTNRWGDNLQDVARKRGFTEILNILRNARKMGKLNEIKRRDSLWRDLQRQKLMKMETSHDKENIEVGN
eukprot:GFUD01028137.1.p1 GENE.GFUD01028137.1~~GFUD01028137.1.p1  ORF type:complete len:228 (+),score=65.88 GFUD01028137.1:90-773(+)